jgi:hypothetical protein
VWLGQLIQQALDLRRVLLRLETHDFADHPGDVLHE